MKLDKLVTASFLAAAVGCSNPPPKIFDEKPIAEQVRNKPHEWVIEAIKTPQEAGKYTTEYLVYKSDSANYGKCNHIASFKKVHWKGKDDCDGGAIAAAAVLKDNGYPPLYLRMYMYHPMLGNCLGHAVYPYQENKTSGLWGALGISKEDCKEPKFSSIRDLVKSFGYYLYDLLSLDEINPNWTEKDIGSGQEIGVRELMPVYSEED